MPTVTIRRVSPCSTSCSGSRQPGPCSSPRSLPSRWLRARRVPRDPPHRRKRKCLGHPTPICRKSWSVRLARTSRSGINSSCGDRAARVLAPWNPSCWAVLRCTTFVLEQCRRGAGVGGDRTLVYRVFPRTERPPQGVEMRQPGKPSIEDLRKEVHAYLAALSPEEGRVLRARFSGLSPVGQSADTGEDAVRALAREIARVKKKRR